MLGIDLRRLKGESSKVAGYFVGAFRSYLCRSSTGSDFFTVCALNVSGRVQRGRGGGA